MAEYEKKTSAGKAKVITVDFYEGKVGYENVAKLKATFTAESVRNIVNDLITKSGVLSK